MIRCRLYANKDGKTLLVLGYGRTEMAAEKKARAHARKRKIAAPDDAIIEFDTVRGKN